MKRITVLGLALTATLALTAVIGISSASATVLCKENATTCPAASIYPSGTTIEAKLKTGTTFTVKSTFNYSCTGSTIGGKTLAEKGAPLPAEVSTMSFSGCSGNCTAVEALNLSYTGEIERGTGGNGTVNLSSGGKGTPSLRMTGCAFGTTCVYSAPKIGLTGGNPASLAIESEIIKLEGSGLCPSSALVVANYEVTSPKPAYATAGPKLNQTVFCKENAVVCPSQSATYPSGTTIKTTPGTTAVLSWSSVYEAVGCKTASLTLESTAEAGSPLPIASLIGFSECSGGCNTVEATASKLSSSVEATVGGAGTFKPGEFSVTLKGCIHGIECVYQASGTEMQFEGGISGKAKITANEIKLTKIAGSFECGSTMKISASYPISSPTPLWLSKAEV